MATSKKLLTSHFFSFDGPKGVGKSTLIQRIQVLFEKQGYPVRILTEKELDPYREETRRILQDFTKNPSIEKEQLVLQQLTKGRIWISKNVLPTVHPVITLMDRWYPSDAVFRCFIEGEDCVHYNLSKGVVRPDGVVALYCDPEISFSRAHQRKEGLHSDVIKNSREHELSTSRFVETAKKMNWILIDSLPPQDDVLQSVVRILYESISKKECF